MYKDLKKMECPSCAMEIDRNSKICSVCGYEFPERNKLSGFIIILMLILMILYFII
jgi:predicted amidophosphoribosyltransferase